MCCVPVVKRLPLLYHSADYSFVSYEITELTGIFGNGNLLMHTFEGVSSVANLLSAYEGSQNQQ